MNDYCFNFYPVTVIVKNLTQLISSLLMLLIITNCYKVNLNIWCKAKRKSCIVFDWISGFFQLFFTCLLHLTVVMRRFVFLYNRKGYIYNQLFIYLLIYFKLFFVSTFFSIH